MFLVYAHFSDQNTVTCIIFKANVVAFLIRFCSCKNVAPILCFIYVYIILLCIITRFALESWSWINQTWLKRFPMFLNTNGSFLKIPFSHLISSRQKTYFSQIWNRQSVKNSCLDNCSLGKTFYYHTYRFLLCPLAWGVYLKHSCFSVLNNVHKIIS